MRSILSFMMVTLDGYHEGPSHELDWPNVDDEFSDFALEQLEDIDLLVFGRNTYEGMASYWPTEDATRDNPMIAGRMNEVDKIVLSTSLDAAEWTNTRLLRGDAAAELATMKEQPGETIGIFGSSSLTAGVLARGVIDEIRVMVNPVLLGDGVPLFRGLPERVHLAHLNTRTFRCGNVLLSYRPEVKR
jgi:dihydrofolate reductase